MILKTLFKRNVNGTINQWSICVEDNSYWTEFGLIDGVITASDKVFTEGKNLGKKNETSAEEQALKDASALFKKKIKSENFVEDITKVDEIAFQPPMLAKVYEEKYTLDIKYCQPKLDGIRCNISIKDGEVIAISRKNNPFYTVEHIKNSLREILQNHPSLHLDGELYNHLLHDDFNKVVSLVKKEHLSDEDKEEVIKYIRYNIYDLWDDNAPNMSFSERNVLINELFQNIPYIDIVPTMEVSSDEDVEGCFDHFTSDGYEGLILRKDAPYEHKRSKNLLKYKKFMDDEFEILDICEGKIKGYAEYAYIKLHDGQICKATLSYSDDECANILNKKHLLIGKLATVEFFGYTNDSKLRFPILKSIRDYE